MATNSVIVLGYKYIIIHFINHLRACNSHIFYTHCIYSRRVYSGWYTQNNALSEKVIDIK